MNIISWKPLAALPLLAACASGIEASTEAEDRTAAVRDDFRGATLGTQASAITHPYYPNWNAARCTNGGDQPGWEQNLYTDLNECCQVHFSWDLAGCGTTATPVNGGWSDDFDAWSVCTEECGGGTQTRVKRCDNPAPANGGLDCPAPQPSETAACNEQACPDPVDGEWGAWSTWSSCSVACGDGVVTRTRLCDSPAPVYGGLVCVGSAIETQPCNQGECVNQYYPNWSSSSCLADGNQSQWETNLSNTLSECCSKNFSWDLEGCTGTTAPTDGGWSVWSAFGACSATCGGGTQDRSRSCTNPAPAMGGADCVGASSESQACNEQACAGPVDGGWSAWSAFGTCTEDCGGGTQDRTRTCDNPPPANGGADCVGDDIESSVCNEQACPEPIDGGWSDWGDFGDCSVSCGDGVVTRNRTCTNPAPANGGADCAGLSEETQACNEGECTHLYYANWTVGGCVADGNQPSWEQNLYSDLSACCAVHFAWDVEGCSGGPALIDGGWSDWTSGGCSVECGGGSETSTRTCTNPAPANGGAVCVGDSEMSAPCNEHTCAPVDGGWTDWTDFNACSVTCGGGTSERSRSCTDPAPAMGGADCVGNNTESVPCNDQECIGDNQPASPNPPGGLAAANVPMFVSIGFDDNGYSGLPGSGGDGAMSWATTFFKDLVNPAGSGNAATFDGLPARVSFFMTSTYIAAWMSDAPPFVKKAWRQAYDDGHEIGNHTDLHTHGAERDLAGWLHEISTATAWLVKPFDPNEDNFTPDDTKGVGIPRAEITGFRTPFLEYNDATFQALASEGFTYDCSIEEGWQFDTDGSDYNWPYTLDNGSPGHDVLVGWGSKLPISGYPGLWELPVYPLVVPPDSVASQYGIPVGLRDKIKAIQSWYDTTSGKITGFDYNLWVSAKLTKAEFLATLKYSFDLRLGGNRAPFMFGAHTDYYSSKYTGAPATTAQERREAIEEFTQYVLSKPEVRVVTHQQIVDWMRNPVALP